MAKMTNLAILNQVLTNIGEPVVTVLTSLTGVQKVAYDAVNETIYDVGVGDKWIPLEGTGTFTMTTGTNTYAEPTDMVVEDEESIRSPDDKSNIGLMTPQEFDRNYPDGVGTATTGYPTAVTRFGGFWKLNKYPASSQNGKIIHFRYWKIPSTLATATTTTTCWFPEGYDWMVLVNLATYKTLHYKGNPEAMVYFNKVYGNGRQEGTLDKMKKQYTNNSGRLKARVTYSF